MVLWATLLVIQGATIAGSMPAVGIPQNITLMYINSSMVQISWSVGKQKVEKYDVVLKPTEARYSWQMKPSYRVVKPVAGSSNSVVVRDLKENTQYQLTITAVVNGVKFRSRPILFSTQMGPNPVTEVHITGGPPPANKAIKPPPPYPGQPNFNQTMGEVRGIEIGIVCLVLLAWVGAIILFFNRWGKIRMLLPYQPDYKDTQLKVPGSCQHQGTSCQATGSTGFCCSQRQLARVPDDWLGSSRRLLATRSRTNSAVYIEPAGLRSEQTEPLFSSAHQLTASKSKSADHLPASLPIANLKCFGRDPRI
ncbi:uncharacterized protein LOC106672072 isoform X2 [Cimex lectularius]|uniref:Fibronectin type-III domain-containing protein n=1 Tax=Cimex lectularius TaxID=79782 RepID=A0A8I6SMQ7_CIMLE|nr:uncharacterized protein LOC106672072 isoform X2 [Cimex lectularius]